MKILVIGDPHGSEKAKKVPLKNVDLILVTGDLGKADLARKMAFENINRVKQGLPKKEITPIQRKKAYMQIYNSSMRVVKYYSRFAPVYIIFGNVENSNAETKKLSKEIGYVLPLLKDNLNALKNVKIINNRIVNFKGIRIGGLGYFIDDSWVRDFKPRDKESLKEAKKDTKKAKKILRKLRNLDILLCHQPPYGVLDKVNFPQAPAHWQGKHAGSKVILNYIKKNHPKYVFCGHIHEGKGKKKVGKTEVYNVGAVGDYVLLDIK